MIRVETIGKRFRRSTRPAIESLSMVVPDGRVTGFIGMNGAGKTTTIRIISGLLEPDSGNVFIDDLDLKREKVKASARLGLVPDQSYFDPGAEAGDLLEYMASFYSYGKADSREIALSALERVGLGEERNMKLGKFSLGMAKKFAIAASLINDPPNLILDEVLNGLDPAGMKIVRETIGEFRKENRCVFLSTHSLTELEGIADRLIVIHRGKVVGELLPEDMYRESHSSINVRIENATVETEKHLMVYGSVTSIGKNYKISNPTLDSVQLNAELVRQGYMVSSITREAGSLENAFLQLIAKVDETV